MENANSISEEELPDGLYAKILDFCEKGNILADQEKFAEAYAQFNEALALIPAPQEKWTASTWVFTALGDMTFC